MPKRSEQSLTKHTLNLYEGDYERVQDLYPDIGAAVIIRKVLRQFIEGIEAQAPATAEIPNMEIKI